MGVASSPENSPEPLSTRRRGSQAETAGLLSPGSPPTQRGAQWVQESGNPQTAPPPCSFCSLVTKGDVSSLNVCHISESNCWLQWGKFWKSHKKGEGCPALPQSGRCHCRDRIPSLLTQYRAHRVYPGLSGGVHLNTEPGSA